LERDFSRHSPRIAVIIDSDQSRKTLGPLCSAAPPNAVFAKRKNAAGGLVGQLEARKVELEPSALFR
jgi:hypothetical protein